MKTADQSGIRRPVWDERDHDDYQISWQYLAYEHPSYDLERKHPAIAERYPDGVHGAITDAVGDDGRTVHTATLQEPEHGLSATVLENTDVLVWWSHCANDEVSDEIGDRVVDHVHEEMGFVPVHSGKNSKPFKRLVTTCNIKYRHGGETERIWVADPGHPIADGLEESFEVPSTEMYGEPYDIPEPGRTVFISWFEGGEVFRSGICYRRGRRADLRVPARSRGVSHLLSERDLDSSR